METIKFWLCRPKKDTDNFASIKQLLAIKGIKFDTSILNSLAKAYSRINYFSHQLPIELIEGFQKNHHTFQGFKFNVIVARDEYIRVPERMWQQCHCVEANDPIKSMPFFATSETAILSEIQFESGYDNCL